MASPECQAQVAGQTCADLILNFVQTGLAVSIEVATQYVAYENVDCRSCSPSCVDVYQSVTPGGSRCIDRINYLTSTEGGSLTQAAAEQDVGADYRTW